MDNKLTRNLTLGDLIIIGLGGAGVFVVMGTIAALQSGPSIIISCLIAGIGILAISRVYSSLFTYLNVSGGVYGCVRTLNNQILSRFTVWSLFLLYTLGVATAAKGCAGYIIDIMKVWFSYNLMGVSDINIPAMLIYLPVILLLASGNTNFNLVNKIIVISKFIAISIFIYSMTPYFQPEKYWNDFMPYGYSGIIKGAGILLVVFAVGIEFIATAHGEAINPQRNIPLAIIIAALMAIVIHISVAVLLTGSMNYYHLITPDAMSYALNCNNCTYISPIISIGAIMSSFGSLILGVFSYSRVLHTTSLHKILPTFLSITNSNNVPSRCIILAVCLCSLLSGFVPFDTIINVVGFCGAMSTAMSTICLIITHHKNQECFDKYTYYIAILLLIWCVCVAVLLLSESSIFIVCIYALGIPFYFGHHVYKFFNGRMLV